jgi:hypothetical protein
MAKTSKGRKSRKGNPLPTRPQEEKRHPDEWDHDLNPNRIEGQNIGRNPVQNDPRARTAAEIKNLTQRLTDFRTDELAQIPIVPVATQLKQGAVYLDLRDPTPIPFTATAGIVAEERNYYTPKAEVPYETWNRLVEILGPAPVKAAESYVEAKVFSSKAGTEKGRTEAASEAGRGSQSSSETGSQTMVDEAVADTFPASDPPSWTTGRERNAEFSEKGDDLNALSDQELNKKARELNVQGRDSMNREQLILAIRGQLSGSKV